MKIKAKDFEIIDNLELELKEGITVIVGASNNGKSSLIRLLRSIIYNLNGDSSIQQGESSYTLGIIEGDNKILVKRDMNASNKTVYSVNGEVLKKVGRNTIPEVESALNMRIIDINKKKMELNFLRQMEHPFLIFESSAFIYDFLSSSSNQADFTGLIKTMKADLKDISDNKKHLEGRVDTLKDLYQTSKSTYEKLESIDPLVQDILDFDANIQYLSLLENSINKLEYADKESIKINSKLDRLLSSHKVLDNLDTCLEGLSKIKELEELISKVESIQNEIYRYEVTLKSLKALHSKLDLNTIEDMMNSLSSLSSYKNSISESINNVNNIITLQESIENVNNKNLRLSELLSSILDLNSQGTATKVELTTLDNFISDFESLIDKLGNEALFINNSLDELQDIEVKLGEFDVCPLCNSVLKGGSHCER